VLRLMICGEFGADVGAVFVSGAGWRVGISEAAEMSKRGLHDSEKR